MYRNLRHFIDRLESEGELARITARVDPILEIAEITDRVCKSSGGGKALLFENTGTSFPVLTNMFGSDRRIAMALGVDSLDEIGARIDSMLKKALSPKDSLGDKLRMLPMLKEMSEWLPKTTKKRGECQQVILEGSDAMLSLLPILKCWPHDGGRFVTLPLVNTVDPDTGIRNVGMYRMQVTGEYTTGMHWHVHKTGERHYRAYQRRGERMPVSVCMGGDPAYTYAATAPMPDNMDEYLLAGFLRRRSVRLVKCVTNDIYVPSDCDFVIEGYVDTSKDKFTEGPFGDHTGFYSLDDLYPEFRVTAITHRRDAIYSATIVGVPPQEDVYIAKATEKIFLAPIRLALQPEIEDLYMPSAGIAHNLALTSIHTTYPGQAFKTASSMWGAGQMMFNKILLVIGAGVDLRDQTAIAPLLRNADLAQDVMFSRGVLDILDHATATPGMGGKMAFDLTSQRSKRTVSIPDNFKEYEWLDGVDVSLTQSWGILVLYARPGAGIDPRHFTADNNIDGVNYMVVVDSSARELSHEELLWFAAGNTDPGRDIKVVDGVMHIDARSKTPFAEGYPNRWPNVVTSSPDTIALVDMRQGDYGLGELPASPSGHYARLVFSNKAEV